MGRSTRSGSAHRSRPLLRVRSPRRTASVRRLLASVSPLSTDHSTAIRRRVESMASMESFATPSPAPAFLIQGSLGDARVPAWGMLRWATEMRRRAGQMQCGSQPPMVLTMSDNGDHLGTSLN